MGSDSISLKELRVRMSGTASNGNYGNLSPDVTLTFGMEGVENWNEAIAQCVGVTHDAYMHAAADLVSGFIGSRRDTEDMMRELGLRVATEIVPVIEDEGNGTDVDVLARVQRAVGAVGADEEHDPGFVELFNDADSSGNGVPDWDEDDDLDYVNDDEDDE